MCFGICDWKIDLQNNLFLLKQFYEAWMPPGRHLLGAPTRKPIGNDVLICAHRRRIFVPRQFIGTAPAAMAMMKRR